MLYSKIGDIGPERSALESGLANYFVASYADSPKIYRKSYGTPMNLEEAKNIRPVTGPDDRVGESWASFFFHLRQTIGRETIDKAVFKAWFQLPKEAADQSLPTDMMAKLLERLAPAPGSPSRAVLIKLAQQHGAPLPRSAQGK